MWCFLASLARKRLISWSEDHAQPASHMAQRPPGEHLFGGDWTSEKLKVLEAYLKSYTTALKRQQFKTAYIDAFAGTGYRAASDHDSQDWGQTDLFGELGEPEAKLWLDGSARLALKIDPRFDKYIFIERNQKRCIALEELKTDFPKLANDIDIRRSEANKAITSLCQKNWKGRRAVLFLDPYGMQVEWTTILAIARTEAIDMWLLFPLGIGVNRLLTRTASIPEAWTRRLDLLLGTSDWFDAFYSFEERRDLFGEPVDRVVKASTETIGKFFNDPLKDIFAGVAKHPRVLRNRVGCPLYLLCYAAGNPKGAPVAVRIAEDLLSAGTE
jgi:three-Cys-motif partner protein